MHRLIYILTYAKDAEDALDAAHKIVEEKLGYRSHGGPFDYYVDFTEDNIALFGNTHWGPIPPVLQVSNARYPIEDKRGLEMVYGAMEKNRETFKDAMVYVRSIIADYTDDQLFDIDESKGAIIIDDEGLSPGPAAIRLLFGDACGGFPGPGAFLYDFMGRTISRPHLLQRILSDSDSNPRYVDDSDDQNPEWGPHIWSLPLWVVPFDARISDSTGNALNF